MIRVTYFFRKREPHFNSIEEIFSTVIKALPRGIAEERYEVPVAGVSFKSILRNLIFASKYRGDINHITGHINYIALGLRRNVVLTVHDIGSSFTGKPFRDFLVKVLWYWLPALMVKRITVISRFSKGELGRLIPFARKKIRVVNNPGNASVAFRPKKFNSNKPRILHMGTKPNKNL